MATIHTARKDHALCRSCGQPILAGQVYKQTQIYIEKDRYPLQRGEREWKGRISCKIHLHCLHPDNRTAPYRRLFKLMARTWS